jgi:hypothetical protein
MIIYGAFAFVVCCYLAFALNFVRATRYVAENIAVPEAVGHIQDAITPPFSAVLFLSASVAFAGCVIGAGVKYGWMMGVCSVPVLFLVVLILRRVVPSPESGVFRRVVVRSMQNRYADFVKSGDTVRAGAMSDLLRRLGHPISPHLDSNV